jgi:radical SAM protein with 4Fe4S-binding SPASM domain
MLLDFFKKKQEEEVKPQPYNYFSNRPAHPFLAACYAPFKSMYFGHKGKVIACCQNRDYVLGNYPAQSISDIWNSNETVALRNALKQDNFNLGCQNCELRIKSGNAKGLIATFYDENPINELGYPTSFEFELSNTCNLECIMCNGDFSSLIRTKREKRDPIPQVYDRAFVEQLREFIPHLKKVSFYGGEPFLIDIYSEIWEEIIKMGTSPEIFVQTNGTVLSNRVKKILEQLRFNIGISLDSISEENYPKIRVNGRLSETLKNVDYFKNYTSAKGTSLYISICPMQQNWHELVSIVAFADSIGAETFIHQVITASRNIPLSAMPPNELQHVYNSIKAEIDASTACQSLSEHNRTVLNNFLNDLVFYIQNNNNKPIAPQ